MGRLGIVIPIALLAAAAALLSMLLPNLDWYVALSPMARPVVFGGAVLAFGAALHLPVALLVRRAVERLRAHLSNVIAGRPSDATGCDAPAALKWIAPTTPAVASACLEALNEVLRRERDLSERLRDLQLSHRILETEYEQLYGVLNTLRDGVIVTDSFNEVITINDAASEILGFSREQGRRKSVDEIVADERLCRLIHESRDAGNFTDTRMVEHDIEVNAERVPYQIALTALENNKGEAGAVVTILHDLRHEREIAQMKSDFVSKASHELRTPLSSIRAYVEMLVDGEANDEDSRREFYTIIQNETERLGRMIDNMLNISRIEAGIIQIDREMVDFRPLIERAMETLEPQAREKKITLTMKAAAVDLTAEGDADMLYQVVLNLVSNSIKYTPEGGRVVVAADSDNLTRSIVVTVTDTGLGIPPDALPRLFEKFFRIESFKRVAKGTGLGLNLCKHIVETVHHGQIGVESKLGMGSKFWFTVPMSFIGAAAA